MWSSTTATAGRPCTHTCPPSRWFRARPVTAGQTIGYVGQTGVATGNHCHFEMKYNGSLVSARSYFPNIRSGLMAHQKEKTL